jgi:cytoskeleton protein RodZ
LNKVTQLPIEQPSAGDRTKNQSGQALDTQISSDVGGELRAARMRRGDDLSAVSRVLRIRKDHLEAIEENRFDDLPGRTYAVGFVRSYAQYLELDARECVERLKAGLSGRSEPSLLKGLPEDTGDSRLPYGWLFMALVVLGVVGFAGYHLVRSAELRSPPASVAPVPAVMAPETVRHASVLKRAVPAHQRADLAARPAAPSAGATATPLVTGAGRAQNSLPPTSAPVGSTLAAPPPGQVYGAQNRNARVVLHARAVTHVVVEGPGGRVYINRVLHPGDAYRVPDLVGLSLTTPDGGAVSVELDGQDMGVAGHTGQITEALPLDPQAIVDRTHAGNPG